MKKINIRKLVLALADILIIVVSGIVLNYVLSLTGVIGAEASRGLLYYTIINLITCILSMFVCGSYSRFWRYFNIKDYAACAAAMTVGFILAYAILLAFGKAPRRIFELLYFLVATFGVLAFRFVFKRAFLDLTESGRFDKYERTLIVGAGNAGRMILTEIENA